MSKIKILITLLFFLFIAHGKSFAQKADPTAVEVAELLAERKFNKIHKKFSGKIKLFFSKKKFNELWENLEAGNGSIQSVGKPKTTRKEDQVISKIPVSFENIALNMAITTNEKGKIIGFTFQTLDYVTPDWAKNKVFGKERLTIVTDTFEMEGEIVLPNNFENCPVVIIVHGSGPSDMNGTFGPNKLYQDLAYGLALQGIATIRYNKRTYTYGKQLATIDSFTLYDETIDDAISAVQKVSEYFYLDTNRIFVLGHSLGAFSAPIIASECKEVDGIIVLAGSPRPYYQIIPEQYQYLSEVDSNVTEEEQERLDRAIEERKFIDGEPSSVDGLKEMGNDDMIYYHRHMKTFDIIDSIQSNKIKTLIIQGDRDYQVPHATEFKAFKDKLNNTDWVTFTLVEGANHQMVEWTGKPTPGEYYKQGHIDFNTIVLLSDWILGK